MIRWTDEELAKALTLGDDDGDRASRAYAGRLAKVRGELYEDQLMDRLVRLEKDGQIVKAWRQMPPMRSAWFHGRLVFFPQAGGPCDFAIVFRSGLHGVFDAKSTGNDRSFSWPKDQDHQLEELRSIHNKTDGASPAFAMVQWRTFGEERLHPVPSIVGRSVRRDQGVLVVDLFSTLAMLWPAIL